MIADQRQEHLNNLRAALSVIVYPVQYLVDLPFKTQTAASESLSERTQLLKENKTLKHEALILKNRLLKFSALEKENIRLRGLLENSFKLGEQVLIAELLSVNLNPYKHEVVINKGSRFGIFNGQAAIDAYGVTGQVIRANPLSSEVILITDPSHAISVEINRNGLRTIAVGSGLIGKIELPFLPNNSDIRVGDLLVTSGLDNTFPAGYPVGTITEIDHEPGNSFAIIHAKPAAQLDKSRELLMVWSSKEPIPLFKKEEKAIANEEGQSGE